MGCKWFLKETVKFKKKILKNKVPTVFSKETRDDLESLEESC